MINDSNLDLSLEDFRMLLQQGNDLVLKQFGRMDSQKAYSSYEASEVASWFHEELPEEGLPLENVLSEVEEKVLKTATGNLGPHMYAYVMTGGTQVSIVAEQLAATINQNLGKWHLAPSLSEIEKRVVQWGASMIGLEGYVGGVMVSGGSAANLAGLTVARNIFFEKYDIRKKGLFGQKPFVVYASKEVHGCVDKSLEQLGIGTDYLRKIDTNPDFTISIEALRQQIQLDMEAGLQPFCVVGNAGTVNTGAIDDLSALAEVAREYQLWFHVDGAYGGLAATLPSIKSHYKGMEQANSIAIDFHKWLYQPFEAGCLLVRDWETLRRAYFKKADYLDSMAEGQGRLNFNEHHFQLSRNGKAFKVWMSIKAYGMKRLRSMIQKDIDLTHYLARAVEGATDFELHSESHLAVACFRYTAGLTNEEAIDSLNQGLVAALETDGRVFIMGTKLNGLFVLRACLINHRKQEASIEYLLEVIREVGNGLL